MSYKTALSIVFVAFLFLQSCGGNVFKADASQKQQIQAEQYQPAIPLERLQKGTYGICESCGSPIPLERLRALPHATLCVPCKRREESEATVS